MLIFTGHGPQGEKPIEIIMLPCYNLIMITLSEEAQSRLCSLM